MNQNQVRVIDPILSDHARGYRQAGLIGHMLFPRAYVSAYGGQVIEFGKDAFRLYNVKRSPGTATKRISFGYEGKSYAIVPGALEATVAREHMTDAAKVPGINLATRSINTVLRAMSLGHEYECAQIARNPSNYDNDHKVSLTGTNRCTSDDSDPSKDVETAKEAVADTIGIEPNTLMLSRKALSALRYHPKLIERLKYTSVSSITLEMLQNIWEVDRIVVGAARVATGVDDVFGDVWGHDAWFGYVNESPDPNNEEPSYGYTYTIEGHPAVEEPYWDRNTKSWVYGVSDDNSPVLSGMNAGYLIKDAGLPAA